jgi:hypothetical protein
MKPLRSKMKVALRVAVLGVVTASFYACILPVGNGESPAGGLLTSNGDPQPLVKDVFVDQVLPIFITKCAQCHAPGGIGYQNTGDANGGLNLSDSAAVYSTLVQVATFESPGTAPTLRLDTTVSPTVTSIRKFRRPHPSLAGGCLWAEPLFHPVTLPPLQPGSKTEPNHDRITHSIPETYGP